MNCSVMERGGEALSRHSSGLELKMEHSLPCTREGDDAAFKGTTILRSFMVVFFTQIVIKKKEREEELKPMAFHTHTHTPSPPTHTHELYVRER